MSVRRSAFRLQRAGAGFTLLELLLALSLSALLGVGIYQAFRQGRVAENRATAEADARQVGRIALEWIARDLAACVETASAFNPGLNGLDAELGEEPADTLYFTATSHLPSWRELDDTPEAAQLNPMAALFGGAAAAPEADSDFVQVEYYIGTDPTTEAPGLLRRVRTLPTVETTDQAEGFTTIPLAREVVGLDFKFYDGSDWLDSWDSAESESYPEAIQITVIVRVGPEGDPDDPFVEAPTTRRFTRTVVLATEPFVEQTSSESQPAQGGVR